FVFEGSVEHRVREVLEKKLAIIFEEFGIDKTGDVLDSAQAGRLFDDMYVEAILNPDKIEDSVEGVIARLQEQARVARSTASVLGATQDLEPGEAQRLLTHPLPHWVERMTVSYLKSRGGQVERRNQGWDLTWPDGQTFKNVVFAGKEAERLPAARHLTLEEPRVRGLAMRIPRCAPGQPVPVVAIPGVSAEVQGIWSLWRIAIASASTSDEPAGWNRRRIMPLFLADSGRVFVPTARHIWDQLLAVSPLIRSILDPQASQAAFAGLQKTAEEYGRPMYDALVQEHRNRLAHEREKADYAFAARRRAIGRIGLAQVRTYRLNLLAREEQTIHEQLGKKDHAHPEMVPLLVLRVEGGHE
ncbi:MAG: helicase, partial [Anaerolineae bacterium]